jgi:ABC-type multidrug transport system ATPase subunit
MEPALQVEEISYSYGELEAVRKVSFQLDSGEILGFLGPNGAGKSTTIRMLTGQLEPDSGRITMLGREMTFDDPELQSRMGVCFEEKNLYLNMSARENLAFFARLFGLRDFDPDPLLRMVDLKGRENDRVGGYSKGMKQRLMMARALVNDPCVLFLDEPTDGLDPVSSRTLRRIIREQADRGAAVLLTTHDMWEADALSDRVAFLNDGILHAIDTPEALKLAYGRRSVRFRFANDSGVIEETVELGARDSSNRIAALASRNDLLTIHTEEASLEDIFIEITGRGLGT